MINLLFVYGTLDTNQGWFDIHGIKYQLIGYGSIYARRIKHKEYPAVVKDISSNKIVIGQIVKLLNPVVDFKKIDEYEEYYPNDTKKSLYLRELTQVDFKNTKLNCWIYWYNQNNKK